MADDVILPGTGERIATDEVDVAGTLKQFQLIKPAFGTDGQATLVSLNDGLPVNAVGELIEAVEALRMTVGRLAGTQGAILPDVAGRMRIAIDAITAGLTLATITTVGTVTTVSTVTTVASVTNQAQIGGFQANDQIPALMRIAADALRRNISVT